MSRLISSLLIEPVQRQARWCIPPQSDPRLPVLVANPNYFGHRNPAPLKVNNDIFLQNSAAMSCIGQESPPGAPPRGEFTERNDNPSLSTARPMDENCQHHTAENSVPSEPHRNDTNYIASNPVDQTDVTSCPRNSSISSTNVLETNTPTTRDAGRYPSNILDLEETAGWNLLPEDDGMGTLRKRIHDIRDRQTSNTEKARMIHELMTENYNASRGHHFNAAPQPGSHQYGSQSTEPRENPAFCQIETANETPILSSAQRMLHYNLTTEDVKPTFSPKTEPEVPLGDEDLDAEEVQEAHLGCQHYKRNVKLQCYTCKRWYTCRFCHDHVEDHHLDRPKTENMLCMLCGQPQPAAQVCRDCGEQAAQYYCNVCKLWDNDSNKSIYHCADCGICRIGQGLGKDFFHCKTCCVCLPISIENTHRCIERSTQCDCPICGEYMFTSPETVVFMRCGHSIHQKCLTEYSKSSYRCPICNKTITNMESTFRNLDRTIESQPMPAEFTDTKSLVYCNDCGVKSVVKYHWLGLKCDMCESYNTAQIRLLHGDVLDTTEEGDGIQDFSVSRMRSSSHGHDAGTTAAALAALRLDTSSASGPNPESLLNLPSSAEPSGRFASYSLTRGRAVSPVISNYFGIPTDRGSERSQSDAFLGRRAPRDNERDDYGEVRLWGTKFKYRYGFLSRETESTDGMSEGEHPREEEASSEYSNSDSGDDDGDEEDDEDDDDERIDIIGHR